MDRALAMVGLGGASTAALTLVCARPSAASSGFDSFKARPLRAARDRDGLPHFVDIVVEVPRGSFIKRTPSGEVDFVAPLPSPFNYGSVPAVQAADGDPLDAIILGNQLPYGYTGKVKVKGIMKFLDAGLVDDKLICTQLIPGCDDNISSSRPGDSTEQVSEDVTALDLLMLTSFFNLYATCKSGLNVVRGKAGRTAYGGWELLD